jgi:IclR family transcriptional regulator, pca regulon regulatory protein
MIDRDYIKSLEKGLNIISLLSQHGSPLKLEDLVRISGLRKTSCFRILQTLTRSGFILKDKETCGYFIGPKMISIGLTTLERTGIRELALPFMKEIRQKTGATVNLAILNGSDVIFVERLQSAHIIEGNLSVGSRLSAHLSSMGKAMLAHLSEAELNAVVKQIRFEKKTDKTIASVRAFKEELKKIRAAGFAVNNEELATGLFAIAVPLLNHTGAAVAGLNISFLLARHSREEAAHNFVPMIMKAGREISAMMGFRH